MNFFESGQDAYMSMNSNEGLNMEGIHLTRILEDLCLEDVLLGLIVETWLMVKAVRSRRERHSLYARVIYGNKDSSVKQFEIFRLKDPLCQSHKHSKKLR